MARPMPGPKPGAPPVWAAAATIEEVRAFAIERFALSLDAYVHGCRTDNPEKMADAVNLIRNVATRLDQFRRVHIRRGPGGSPAQSQTQKGNT